MSGYGLLLIGESGTGKSFSMKNLNPEETCIINIQGKPLSFKGGKKFKYNFIAKTGDEINALIDQAIATPSIKNVIVDDFQYYITNYYINNITGVPKQTKFDQYDYLGSEAMGIFNRMNDLRDDQKIVFCFHEDDIEGRIDVKIPFGRMIRDRIDPKGLFTITIRTVINDGSYFFQTQNMGSDICKSPEDMFNKHIPNDLNFVFKTIDAYEYDQELPDMPDGFVAPAEAVKPTLGIVQPQVVKPVAPVAPIQPMVMGSSVSQVLPQVPVQTVIPVQPIETNKEDGIKAIIEKFGGEPQAIAWLSSQGTIGDIGFLSELPVESIKTIHRMLGNISVEA
jgi:hypothetical protein